MNLFSHYNATIEATICFLKLLNVKVNSKSVSETLQNHPDWPNLLCIGDSLSKWNINNGAGKLYNSELNGKIDYLPTPFIAHTNNIESPLSIVTNISNETVTVYQNNYKKPVLKERQQFLTEWDGIYLIAEPSEHSGELEYQKIKYRNFIYFLIKGAVFTLLLLMSFLKINESILVNSSIDGLLSINIHYFLSLIGILTCGILLIFEFDKTNPFLNKVCSSIPKANCNAILNSNAAKVFSWLSWSEIGFIYFLGTFTSLVFAANHTIQYFAILSSLSLITIPYPIYSILYQWKIAKQWCILCLIIQAVLLAQIANILLNKSFVLIPDIAFTLFFKIALNFLFIGIIWFSLKGFLIKVINEKRLRREYHRFKFNPEVFNALLRAQKKAIAPTVGLGIEIGDPFAENTLIVVCNPYCNPCSKDHTIIEDYMNLKNIKVQFIFNATISENDKRSLPVKLFLAIDAVKGKSEILKALEDWHSSKEKNYELFTKKHSASFDAKKLDEKVKDMSEWCEKTDIRYTPTYFLNGHELPQQYRLLDIKYFLSE